MTNKSVKGDLIKTIYNTTFSSLVTFSLDSGRWSISFRHPYSSVSDEYVSLQHHGVELLSSFSACYFSQACKQHSCSRTVIKHSWEPSSSFSICIIVQEKKVGPCLFTIQLSLRWHLLQWKRQSVWSPLCWRTLITNTILPLCLEAVRAMEAPALPFPSVLLSTCTPFHSEKAVSSVMHH